MTVEVFQHIVADGDWSELFSALFGALLLYFAGLLVGVFAVLLPIGAVALRAAAKWIASIDVEFSQAYTTLLIAGLILGLILGPVLLISAIVISFSSDPRLLSIFPLAFIVQSLVVARRLSVTFAKALLISLVTLSILAGIVAVGYFARLAGTELFRM